MGQADRHFPVSIYLFSLCYSEDTEDMAGCIQFIDEAIVADPEREFSFVVPDKRLAFIRTLLKRFDLVDDARKGPPVGMVEGVDIIDSFPGKFDGIGPHLSNPYAVVPIQSDG